VERLSFEVEDCIGCLNPSKFPSRLTIPVVDIPYGGYGEHAFTADSRSKKAAEHAAAEKVRPASCPPFLPS
jgi:hypothetical protein